MSLRSMCRSRVTVQRQTVTKDASGGMVQTYADLYTDRACDIQPASGRVREQYMQQNLAVSHTIYLADAITILPGDRLVSNGHTFLFQGLRPAAFGYDVWPTIVDVEEQVRS